jgi:hypothetical protein
MNRRLFLKLSATALIEVVGCQNRDRHTISSPYDITVTSDMKAGHQLLWPTPLTKGEQLNTEYIIVGSGLAGLSAAERLADRDFILCELSASLGGSSSHASYAGESFSQGAHYDLAYPANYGRETLALLEKLGIVAYDPIQNCWNFVDKQYLIRESKAEQIRTETGFQSEILTPGPLKTAFLELVLPYQGQMKMPTWLIDRELHWLDQITFRQFLARSLDLTPDFERVIDYQMRDDYGASANQVSALAGIHYYTCRPYYTESVELFSPPEGNYYFVKKLVSRLNPQRLKTQHLVKRIERDRYGFQVEVIDLSKKALNTYRAKFIVFAGQKHSLQYIFEPDQHLFSHNVYAPWLVMNLVLSDRLNADGFWQNEILEETNKVAKKTFMGFVDNATQVRHNPDYRILTAYYCFIPDQRQILADIETHAESIVERTVTQISNYFNRDISPLIERVFLKLMGHAMPIPKVNYLFDDQNQYRSEPGLVYAGVDNSRLPLLFEAMDSGIQAVKLLDQI